VAEPRKNPLPWETPGEAPARSAPPVVPGNPNVDSTAHQFALLKGRIHRRLLERLNLANLDKTDRDYLLFTSSPPATFSREKDFS